MRYQSKIEVLLKMVETSISDASICEEDLKFIDRDFQLRYVKQNEYQILSDSERDILDKIKNDLLVFRKRTYVKTLFSNIEGIIFATKQLLLEDKDNIGKEEDIIKLQEFKLEGSSTDKLKEIKIHAGGFLENIKFTFRMYKDLNSHNYDIARFYTQLDKFKSVREIRNRVTHPKHSSDFNISDSELDECKSFREWFFTEYNNLLNI